MKEATYKVIKMCGIEPESIVDGPGFRYVVFVQGCSHRCLGCHNPESHDPDGGYEVTTGEVYKQILEDPYLRGVTYSGGEPFEQVPAMLELARMIKQGEDNADDSQHSSANTLTLMSYTGYTLEQLLARHDQETDELLSLIDILVDGPYIQAQRNLTLVYRGSENQRVIDMNKTREASTHGTYDKIALYSSSFDSEIIL